MPKVINEAEVFAAVSKAFTRWGYENATTKMLAEAAGMHEATLFRKYRSKENLYIRAMEHEFSHAPLAQVGYSGDLEADLLGIVKAYLDTLRSHGDIMTLLLVAVQRYPALREAATAPMRNIRAIASIIEKHQTRGVLVAEDPMDAVAALIGPLMARHLHRHAGTPGATVEIDPERYVERFLLGRKPTEEAEEL